MAQNRHGRFRRAEVIWFPLDEYGPKPDWGWDPGSRIAAATPHRLPSIPRKPFVSRQIRSSSGQTKLKSYIGHSSSLNRWPHTSCALTFRTSRKTDAAFSIKRAVWRCFELAEGADR